MWTYRCVVVRVVDGDTIDIDIDLGFGVHKIERVRLAGIDTPERGEPGWADATAFTAAWVAAHPDGLTIRSTKPRLYDKYGRYLAELRHRDDTVTINEALIASGHARRR